MSAGSWKIAHAPTARRMTDDEWIALSEDEPGELVDGVLEEEEVPDWIHETVVGWLVHVLRGWLGSRGFVAGSEARYLLRDGRGRKPDVSVILPGSPPPPRRGPVRRPPDIMIEVVSTKPRDVRRDRIDKMDEYAAFGVHWYWVVDPEARTFEIHELGAENRYVWALGASAGRLAIIPGCAGLVVDLDELWTEVDRLGPEDE